MMAFARLENAIMLPMGEGEKLGRCEIPFLTNPNSYVGKHLNDQSLRIEMMYPNTKCHFPVPHLVKKNDLISQSDAPPT